jgi:hypothetical protein
LCVKDESSPRCLAGGFSERTCSALGYTGRLARVTTVSYSRGMDFYMGFSYLGKSAYPTSSKEYHTL